MVLIKIILLFWISFLKPYINCRSISLKDLTLYCAIKSLTSFLSILRKLNSIICTLYLSKYRRSKIPPLTYTVKTCTIRFKKFTFDFITAKFESFNKNIASCINTPYLSLYITVIFHCISKKHTKIFLLMYNLKLFTI